MNLAENNNCKKTYRFFEILSHVVLWMYTLGRMDMDTGERYHMAMGHSTSLKSKTCV